MMIIVVVLAKIIPEQNFQLGESRVNNLSIILLMFKNLKGPRLAMFQQLDA
jgi:hypothetical protein